MIVVLENIQFRPAPVEGPEGIRLIGLDELDALAAELIAKR